MTSVYNHFALPPTLPAFCDAVLAMSRDAALVKPGQLDPFAQRALPSIEIVFDDFYHKYDQYLADAAAWDAPLRPDCGAAWRVSAIALASPSFSSPER